MPEMPGTYACPTQVSAISTAAAAAAAAPAAAAAAASGEGGNGGFPKLGVPLWGPHHKDYGILGSILGSPYLG